MGRTILQPTRSALWRLVERQHGVVTRSQLLALGFSRGAIEHRMAAGRLHPVARGVYALGRPQLTLHGRWMAAVLTCGPTAALSHECAAAVWKILSSPVEQIDVSVPAHVCRRSPGVVVHRRVALVAAEFTQHQGLPVTSPICTLIDVATRLDPVQLESAINEADKLDLVDPETLRAALDRAIHRPGVRAPRAVLDRRTFTVTDSQLERRFLPIARSVGLETPETGSNVNGFRVDFYWPELGLVVETDGLRYHRTPAQQARDRLRDQAHAAAGLTPLRFTRAQVWFEQEHVRTTLASVARRLSTAEQSGTVARRG